VELIVYNKDRKTAIAKVSMRNIAQDMLLRIKTNKNLSLKERSGQIL
jgi:hypothetical protein